MTSVRPSPVWPSRDPDATSASCLSEHSVHLASVYQIADEGSAGLPELLPLGRLLAEEQRVVELAPVRENVRVGVGRVTELALPDEARDLGPGPPVPVKKRDPPVAAANGRQALAMPVRVGCRTCSTSCVLLPPVRRAWAA